MAQILTLRQSLFSSAQTESSTDSEREVGSSAAASQDDFFDYLDKAKGNQQTIVVKVDDLRA